MAAPNERSRIFEVKDEIKELKEEAEHWLGKWICCRKIAHVSIPVLEKNRQKVLYTTHILCGFCIVLSIVGFIGAFAYGETLSRFSWVSLQSSQASGHAGVIYKCWEQPNGSTPETGRPNKAGKKGRVTVDPRLNWRDASFLQGSTHYQCDAWYDKKCSLSRDKPQCEACRHAAIAITLSAFISLFSVIAFSFHTDRRSNGNDGNWEKFVTIASALLGGTNFLFLTLGYWYSCVADVESSGIDARPGVGLIAITAATILKIFMGILHLGLPVQKHRKGEV